MRTFSPREVSARRIEKRYKCNTCNKAGLKIQTPGAISFFDQCTFTSGCRGKLTVDANAALTDQSLITWIERDRVVEHSFTNEQYVVVNHNFGVHGTVLIDLFISVYGDAGIPTLIKQPDYRITSRNERSITIDIGAIGSGIVVVSNVQPAASTQYQLSNSSIPEITLLYANSLTVLMDQHIDTRLMAGYPINFEMKQYSSATSHQIQLLFFNQAVDPRGRVESSILKNIRVVSMFGKQYSLYTAMIPSEYLVRGTTMTIKLPAGIDGHIMYARSDKTSTSDIVRDRVLPCSAVTVGNTFADGVQWVVKDANTLLVVDPPLLLV